VFDHLNWWQILVVLAPIVGVMQLIKWREQRAGETPPSQLTQEQKAWVLLMVLPPGLAASLMKRLPADELAALIEAGSHLKGSGRPAAEAVLGEFYHNLPSKFKRGESPDMLERVALAVEADPEMALQMLRTGQPLVRVEPAKPGVPAEGPV
jgi:hypothetical protein